MNFRVDGWRIRVNGREHGRQNGW